MTKTNEREFLGVADVVALLDAAGVSRTGETIRNWIENGDLPATKVGGRYVIAKVAVDEMIASIRNSMTLALGRAHAHTNGSTAQRRGR